MLPLSLIKDKPKFMPGEVALVGAGSGDPDLLTIQAFRFIQQADVVIYDRLVSQQIMSLVPEQSELIYVGKKQANHRVPQDGINDLLVQYARQNKRVLRLKGGDPFVFGRGGEELLYVQKHGIACHIIPGVTAATSCSAYSGIPLTHRDIAQSCTFITGHMRDGEELDLPWDSLANKNQTIVFYMGVKQLPFICQTLVDYGRHLQTPAALIRKGTTPEHQVVKGTLGNLDQLVIKHNITPPTLVIIGDVVNVLSERSDIVNGYFAATKPAQD